MPTEDLGSLYAQCLDMLSVLARHRPALRKLLSYGPVIGAECVHLAAFELLRVRHAADVDRRRGPTPRGVRGHTESLEYRVPDAAPRKLAAFAKRCEGLVAEVSELLGVDLADLRKLAMVARAYQDLYQRDPSARRLAGHKPDSIGLEEHNRGGRKMAPETPLADALDVLLEPIPAEERRTLIGELQAEWFGTKNASGEQVRSRIRDFRQSHDRGRRRNGS